MDDKVLVVTGAGSGLGRATSIEIAKQGGTVIACDLGGNVDGPDAPGEPLRETLLEIRNVGGEGSAIPGDIRNRQYVESVLSETISEYGRIDGVVNYAGILRDNMVFNMENDEFEEVLDVHLIGHFNLLSTLSAHWRDRYKEEGLETQRSFIGVSSAAARGNPGQVNYSAAKAGVLGMVRTAARELLQYNIRVNAVIPAAVTPMMKRGIPSEQVEQWPVEKLGPEKVAPMPMALLADSAQDMTGWTFAIGGDSVYTVSDPEFSDRAIMPGGWTPDELSEVLDDLVADDGRMNDDYAGLFGKLAKNA